MARPRSKLRSFLVTFGFFFGGAALGAALGNWCAPNSALVSISSFFVFPLAMFLGFPAWLGSAFLTLLFNWNSRRKRDDAKDINACIPPGSWVFVPVALGVVMPAGLIAGFASERLSFFGTVGLYLAIAVAYGIGMWRSAKTGLLPFPEEA
jgi:hypothetical protein